jgi:ketosteroid isomerase-like protein
MAATPSETMQAYAAATLAADMEAYASVVTDDFTYVHSSSNLETKAELVDAFTNGRRYRGWEIEGLTERRYPGCAVLNGIGHLLTGRGEPPTPLNVRFTATLVPDGDGWKLAALQTTRLPEA